MTFKIGGCQEENDSVNDGFHDLVFSHLLLEVELISGAPWVGHFSVVLHTANSPVRRSNLKRLPSHISHYLTFPSSSYSYLPPPPFLRYSRDDALSVRHPNQRTRRSVQLGATAVVFFLSRAPQYSKLCH